MRNVLRATPNVTISPEMNVRSQNKLVGIYTDLREKITSGVFKKGDRLPTTSDLSKAMGCSVGMAGKAVAMLLQEGLVEQRQGLGTRVIKNVGEDRSGQLDAFAFIYPSNKHEGICRVLQGFHDAAGEADRRVVALRYGTDFQKEIEFVSRLSEFDARGVVIYPLFGSPKERVRFQQILLDVKFPLVLIEDMVVPGSPFSTVVADGFHAGYTMTRHLLDLGLKKIGFFSNMAVKQGYREKYNGYCWAMEERSVPISPDLVFHEQRYHPNLDNPLLECTRLAEVYLERAKVAEGVVCAEDYLAMGIVEAAREKGLKVPGDLKVTGIGDYEMAATHKPTITTYRSDTEMMGRIAFDLLSEWQIQKTFRQHEMKVRGEIVVRESSQMSPPMIGVSPTTITG
jgi:DNA-binding LacI/PurR family transcriptional regulator